MVGHTMRTIFSASTNVAVGLSLMAAAIIGTLFLIACLVVTGGLIAFLAQPARAHDAMPTAAKPQGWSYPFSCCSGYDCREVTSGPQGTVRERPEGYVIAKTGEVIPYTGDTRLKDSPDGATHWCSVAGADDSRTICLFVPPKGM